MDNEWVWLRVGGVGGRPRWRGSIGIAHVDIALVGWVGLGEARGLVTSVT